MIHSVGVAIILGIINVGNFRTDENYNLFGKCTLYKLRFCLTRVRRLIILFYLKLWHPACLTSLKFYYVRVYAFIVRPPCFTLVISFTPCKFLIIKCTNNKLSYMISKRNLDVHLKKKIIG